MKQQNIVVLDIITTHTLIPTAKIIHIGAVKLSPDFKVLDQVECIINPGIRIGYKIEQLTGITNEYLRKQPRFFEVAHKLRSFMKGCILSGFNIARFDLPILAEEFNRSGMTDFPPQDVDIIDTQSIFHVMQPRDLPAAVRHYVGCEYEADRQFDAMEEAVAAARVLEGQFKVHDIDASELTAISYRDKRPADFSSLFYWDENNELRFNFGSNKNQLVRSNRGAAEWLLSGGFPERSKSLLREYLAQIQQTAH